MDQLLCLSLAVSLACVLLNISFEFVFFAALSCLVDAWVVLLFVTL
jgi:hypothetical protein